MAFNVYYHRRSHLKNVCERWRLSHELKSDFKSASLGVSFFFKDHSSTPHEIGALICHFCFSVKQITNYHNYILFFLSIIYWFFSRSVPLNATRCGESNTVTAKLIWPSCVSLGIVLFYFNWILKHEIAQFHLVYTHVLCGLVRTVLGDRGNKSYFRVINSSSVRCQ